MRNMLNGHRDEIKAASDIALGTYSDEIFGVELVKYKIYTSTIYTQSHLRGSYQTIYSTIIYLARYHHK